MVVVSPGIHIPDYELQFTYARSSGKGGQNVNKTSTKALLRWHVESSSLPAEIKARFLQKYGSRLNQFGELVIQSERHRSQPMNTQDCIEKLVQMIQTVEHAPKIRKKTKVSKSQKKKRLESKRLHSEKKSLRKRI